MAGDANYNSVSILLQGKGAHGSTTFVDTSPSPKTVTATAAVISTAQSKFNGSSMLFNGTSAYLTVPYSSAFVLGAGDVTMGLWMYIIAYPVSAADLAVTNTPYANGYGFRLLPTGTISFIGSTSPGGNSAASSATVLALNTWHYIEGVRSGGVMKVFANGVVGATTASAPTQYDTGGPLVVGRNPTNSSWYFNGHIEGLFLVKGVAEHTGDFAVPTRARPEGLGEVEGVVRDASGALVSRAVRILRRDTGAVIGSTTSDAATGTYRLATKTLDEVVRIVHSDTTTAPLENDLIDRVIPA